MFVKIVWENVRLGNFRDSRDTSEIWFLFMFYDDLSLNSIESIHARTLPDGSFWAPKCCKGCKNVKFPAILGHLGGLILFKETQRGRNLTKAAFAWKNWCFHPQAASESSGTRGARNSRSVPAVPEISRMVNVPHFGTHLH